MSNNPLEIIDEFLGSESPRLRRNALTALAGLHSGQAIERMIKTALDDGDESVRARAEDELAGLDETARQALAEQIARCLDDKSVRLQAYALLGRLRAKGMRLVLNKLSFLQSLSLEFNLFKYVYPERGWKFHLRTFWPAFRASLFSVVFYSALFFWVWHIVVKDVDADHSIAALLTDNQIFSDLIWGVFVVTLLMPLLTFRNTALDLYTDRYKGALIELVWAGLGGAAYVVIMSPMSKSDAGVFLVPVMIAVRLGCLITCGAEFKYGSRHFAESLSGTLAGTLVLLAVVAFEFDGSLAGVDGEWTMWLVLFIPALANSYAVIDSKNAGTAHRTRLYSVLTAYGLLIPAAALLLLALFPERPCSSRGNQVRAGAGSNAAAINIEAVPACRYLQVESGRQAVIDLKGLADNTALRVISEDGTPAVDISTAGNYIYNKGYGSKTIQLDPGQYELVVARETSALLQKNVKKGNALAMLLDHYVILLWGDIRLRQPVELGVTFKDQPEGSGDKKTK